MISSVSTVYMARIMWEGRNITISAHSSSQNICHRSLGRRVDNTSCLHNCQTVLCPLMCSTLKDDFEPTISVEGDWYNCVCMCVTVGCICVHVQLFTESVSTLCLTVVMVSLMLWIIHTATQGKVLNGLLWCDDVVTCEHLCSIPSPTWGGLCTRGGSHQWALLPKHEATA